MNAGDVISERYRIERHIGRGGMQDVYLAQDMILDGKVALKTPQAGQQDKRFKNSAIISARVNHHNVAKTLDYVEENGNRFLIEEYVDGVNLDDRLKTFGAIDPHLAARIFLHVSKGVAASHHAGVVHRDLKPSNIVVEHGVNLHKLKITDFGIATLTEEVFDEAARDGDLTRSTSGTIRGALPYMAPEMMFRQAGDHPGKSVDIWSLGAMMFQIVTGKVPFGVYLQAAVNVQNRNREPWPQFMISNPQYKNLSLQLQNIIDKCLQYDVSDRPSADDVVEEISELCFIGVERKVGSVDNLIQNNYSGFITGEDGVTTFFSQESVYGIRSRASRGNKVCYSSFPGSPRDRGHPIIVIE
ncbi:serine/threonine-protein kinase [Pseudomonas sp.]|jgi:serine/threonine-protein kinase|uniref:serine/threonine-protein kinase n=1 Tax=Pseudomonas sp. TaxID=306 RepID=UPI0033410795